MNKYTKKELEKALQIVSSAIVRCEKMQPRFVEGRSQHTLLKNRLKALYISKSLITGESVAGKYSKEDLMEALKPISSIIGKCEKAQLKHEVGTAYHTRFENMIVTMSIAKSLILSSI